MRKTWPFNLGKLLCCSGWLVAILLAGLVLPRVCNRFFLRMPFVQKENWNLALAGKKHELAARWQDSRPLVIMAGDSHVELGNWYELFDGAFAIRNCGLSRAKIGDVANLLSAVNDHDPEKVVLMCGVNNLGGKDSVGSCVKDYEQLVSMSQSSLHTKKIIVLSVMPVRESRFDSASRELNREILDFNHELEKLCGLHKMAFVDVSTAVSDKHGGLSDGLTIDGLHLNREGYQKIAAVLVPVLGKPD